MPSYNDPLSSVFANISRVNQWQQHQRRVQNTANRMTDDQIAGMSMLAEWFPVLRPGVMRTFAEAGMGPEHPAVQYALRQQARMDVAQGRTGVNEFIDAASLNPGQGRLIRDDVLHGPARHNQFTERWQRQEGRNRSAEEINAMVDSYARRYEDRLRPDGTFYDTQQQDVDNYRNRLLRENRTRYVRRSRPSPPRSGGGGLVSSLNRLMGNQPENLQSAEVAGIADQSLNTVVRGGMMAMDAPIQEVQGQVRNLYAATHGRDVDWLESQSDLGVLLGEGGSTGNGFFVDPNSEIAKERRRREAERGQIGGHNLTLGRIFANGVGLEPDTWGFNAVSGLTDASVQAFADPTILVMGASSKLNRVHRTFAMGNRTLAGSELGLWGGIRESGLIDGTRRYIRRPNAENWFSAQTELRSALRESRRPYEIARATGFRMHPDLARDFATARTDDAVTQVFTRAVNKGKIRKIDDLPSASQLEPRWSERSNRLRARMPQRQLDFRDKWNTAEMARRSMINAQVPEPVIADMYDRIALASTDSQISTALDDAMLEQRGMLERFGITDEQVRRNVVNGHRTQVQNDINDLVDYIGADAPNPDYLLVNGEMVEAASPHHTFRTMSHTYSLPDPRPIRRLTSRYRFLTAKDTGQYLGHAGDVMRKLPGVAVGPTENVGQLRLPFSMMENLMDTVMKPAWLLRMAWPVRTQMDNQMRMAVGGLSNAFSHPIDFFNLVVGRKKNVDVLGDPIAQLDEFNRSMIKGHGDWLRRPGAQRHAEHKVFAKNVPVNASYTEAEYRYAWANQLAELHSNPIANKVASSANLDETVRWLWRGGGRRYRQQLMDTGYSDLSTRDGVVRYVDQAAENIRVITGGNPDLHRAVSSGRLERVVNGQTHTVDIFDEAPHVNKMFRENLSLYTDDGPEFVSGVQFRGNWKQGADRFLDRLFGMFMEFPENTFTRAPTFKQAYWHHVEELIPGASKTAQRKILANARAANLDRFEMRRLRNAINSGSGRISAAELNDLSKGYALDDTKNLLYDLTERRQWADITNLLIPFGDAYQEVMSRWTRLFVESRGKPARRLQQVIQGARGEQAGEFFGAPDGEGFFYENAYGEEVFVYPGSQHLTQWLTDVPVPLVGRVSGLNMIGSFIPGLGPAVQIPMAWFLDRYPKVDEKAGEWLDMLGFPNVEERASEAIVPFGAPGQGESRLDSFLSYGPAWARTLYQAVFEGGYNKRLYANTVMNVQAYLKSTGDYGNTPGEQSRLMEDAADAAQNLTFIRAFAQFAAPSSPMLEHLVETKSGELLALNALSKQYWDWVEDPEVGYENALPQFIEQFGLDAVAAIIPKSSATFYGSPRTREQGEFWAAHEDEAREFPFTFGLFAPQGGEFDINTYIESVVAGLRDPYDPRQWMQVYDDVLGSYFYHDAYRRLETDNPTAEDREHLRAVHAAIVEDYPGFLAGRAGTPEAPETEAMVEELYRARDNEFLSNTPAGRALGFYLDARDQVQAYAQEQGYGVGNARFRASFAEADDLVEDRDFLRDVANGIIQDFPDFRVMWETVFSREMAEDAHVQD